MQSWTWLLPYPKDPLPSPRPRKLGKALTTPELFTLHLFRTLFLLRSPSVSSAILLHLQPPFSPSIQVELVWQKTQTWKWRPKVCAPIHLLHLPPKGDYRFLVWNRILVCFVEVVDVAICGLQQDIVCQFFAARISAILLCLGMLM
jgi:hypothetical protein